MKEVRDEEDATRGNTTLFINGQHKTGKSTVLDIIPDLLEKVEVFPEYKICQINFYDFPSTDRNSFLRKFYIALISFARTELNLEFSFNFLDSSAERWAIEIGSLMQQISKKYNGKVFYLLDEVQRWFQAPMIPDDANVFKSITAHKNQFFAITGSGMATTWNAIIEMRAHSFELFTCLYKINVPYKSSTELMNFCLEKLGIKDENEKKLWTNNTYIQNIAEIFF